MRDSDVNAPAWQNTFPHRVMPLPDERIPGLLLRCDKVNHWGSRTTLTHLLSPGPEKFHRCWRTEMPNLIFWLEILELTRFWGGLKRGS